MRAIEQKLVAPPYFCIANAFMFRRFTITTTILFAVLTAFPQRKDGLVFTIYLDSLVQQIRNIGASGCWYTEEIGKQWPDEKRQRIAELLFSRDFDANGQPKGIGLSSFRFNIVQVLQNRAIAVV